eukprot:783097-Pyramimonas_sp.AAC.2
MSLGGAFMRLGGEFMTLGGDFMSQGGQRLVPEGAPHRQFYQYWSLLVIIYQYWSLSAHRRRTAPCPRRSARPPKLSARPSLHICDNDGPIRRRKRGYILTTDQSGACRAGIFSRRTKGAGADTLS